MNAKHPINRVDQYGSSQASNHAVLRQTDKLLTLKAVAKELNLPEFKIARAARAGIFPTYSLYNSRKLARLSEVIAAIEASKQGGVNG